MPKILFVLACLYGLFAPAAASAWGYQGHRVVGSIADHFLNAHARAEVKEILNPPGSHDPSLGSTGFDLRKAGPWADCVKSVARLPDGTFKYTPNDQHPDYELPCIPFREERARMEDYASRNWTTCPYPDPPDPAKPQLGCHNTFHFDDVSFQRDGFDRSYKGTNPHDLVAVLGAAIAVLTDRPIPPPFAFSIKDKREALLLLTHFIGDLHQPLHVGALYLDAKGKPVDPDAAHQADRSTETAGGNSIQDQNINLHAEWDDIPTDLGDAATRELLAAASEVPVTPGLLEDWPAVWAGDTIRVSHQAFAGLNFAFDRQQSSAAGSHWLVTFEDHTAYLWMMDQIKRNQLAKGGARLAELLNAIWP
jgi:hypothetical protein